MNFFKHIGHQDTLEDKAIIGVIGIPGHLKVLGGPHLGICQIFKLRWAPDSVESTNRGKEYITSLKLTWPLKVDGWKMNFLLGRPIFRGYVSFRECVK